MARAFDRLERNRLWKGHRPTVQLHTFKYIFERWSDVQSFSAVCPRWSGDEHRHRLRGSERAYKTSGAAWPAPHNGDIRATEARIDSTLYTKHEQGTSRQESSSATSATNKGGRRLLRGEGCGRSPRMT